MMIRTCILLILTSMFMNSSYACVTLYSGYDSCPSNSQWPTSRDASAVSTTFSTYNSYLGSIEIYVWREHGYIWAEVIPLTENHFFGGISPVRFIQNGNIIHTEVMSAPNVIQNGYITESTILLLTPIHPPNHAQLNIQDDFILDGNYYYLDETLNVPASANVGNSSSVVDCSVIPYYENEIVYIPCARVPDGAGGINIYRTSWTIIHGRDPLSLELHSLEIFTAD